ncbi:MAG: hypothetical protein DWQ02_11505 [Bacteroidetes bacterium]|nr:MAG: hypothetical protein DWQ02_11505 [Bacteroidota bacterium]
MVRVRHGCLNEQFFVFWPAAISVRVFQGFAFAWLGCWEGDALSKEMQNAGCKMMSLETPTETL